MSHRNSWAQGTGLSQAKQGALFYLEQFQKSLAEGVPKEGMEFFIRGAKDQQDKELVRLEGYK
jgi:hypothetical protein